MTKPTFLALHVLLTAMAHLIAAFSPPGSVVQSAVLVNDIIYVYGGQGDGMQASSNLYTLDVSRSWTTSSPPWANRTSDAGTVSVPKVYANVMWPSSDGNSIYIWGGSGGYNVTKKLAQSGFAQYKIATRSWSIPSTIASTPQERYFATVAWTSFGKAYIWGGWTDVYTGNTSRPKMTSNTNAFDSNKLEWSVLSSNITPRYGHTATILPTNSAVWSSQNAAGSYTPGPLQSHNAELGTDGISIIICGNASDVFVLNTQTWSWTQPAIDGTVPPERVGASAVMVNGQMILFFGIHTSENSSGSYLNDVVILDTRTTPFRWATTFDPLTSTNPLAVVGGIGGIIGIIIAVLFIGVAIFLFIRKPWRRSDNPKSWT
ncbi:hypothetical protein BC938DRAFT_476509 [Jimgerdemannia flammicorona]|uniref:Attractin/MKLN-like beta-propeller domain-containing protein n=1 Tax=Jimgerdemannia flammicorona TaxID=994334 RepID=A0A433QQG9_9FUNG|nr:hypothetical protein BC938DRAFT_476509 [Jimgerdemannia flammicorona]